MSAPFKPLETLKALRNELGLSQSRLAEFIESHARNFRGSKKRTISVDTIKNLEYGKLKLSEDMAERIAAATGISMEWLDKNNRKAPKTGRAGEPWDSSICKAASQSRSKAHEKKRDGNADEQKLYAAATARTVALATRHLSATLAGCTDPWKLDAARFRIARFLEGMKEDFGWNAEEYARGSAAFNAAESSYQKAANRHWKSFCAPLAATAREQGMKVRLDDKKIEVRMTKAQEAAAIRRMQLKKRTVTKS